MEFKERLKQITIRNRKKKRVENEWWPIEKKIEVVSHWLLIGNMKQVGALTGVPYDTVRKWKGSPWWAELEAEIRTTQNIETDTKLSKLIDKSMEAAMDRVENGDFIYDQKTGRIKRKPATLRDVHRVAMDSLDKRELLRGNAVERREVAKISVQEQLSLLAQEFAKWTEKNQKASAIDVEMVEVVNDEEEIENSLHEERPQDGEIGSGLSAREQKLQQSSGEYREEGGEEPGQETGS